MSTNFREQNSHQFHLRWTNLSATYKRKNGLFCETKTHTALHPCSGQVKCGSITAVLGPSGAGKSTLFNCVTGKLTTGISVTGQCFISAPGHLVDQLKRSRIAYVPQTSDFFTLFTVRETLLFASRLNNIGWSGDDHEKAVSEVMVSFDMQDKLDWPLRKLSGGQQKRLAIACELVSHPAAIVLDEPTSGLDADTADKLIRHLQSLVTTSHHTSLAPAVLLSIHTPSLDVFNSFDQVYILATGGYNIYQGPPTSAITFFQSQGFTYLRGNPADWCIDVASSKYGTSRFTSMMDRCTGSHLISIIPDVSSCHCIAIDSINKPQSSTVMQIGSLTGRSLTYYFTKLPQAVTIALCYVFVMLIFDLIMLQEPLVEDAQCWQRSSLSTNFTSKVSLSATKFANNFSSQFNASRLVGAFMGSLLLSIAFIGPVSSLLIVWYHGQIYNRELRNTWYTRNNLFFSKLISESIVRLFCLTACGAAIYHISYDSIEPWRVIILILSMYLLCTVWENLASILTLILGNKLGLIGIASYLTAIIFIDFTLCDPFVFKEDAKYFALMIKNISPTNAAFRVSLIALFGFERCSSSFRSDIISLSIGKDDGPRELFTRAWYTLNMTKNDLINALTIYQIDDLTLYNLFDSLSSWIVPVNNVIHSQPSYILSFYNYYESNLLDHFIILTIWLILSCFALFLTMKRTPISLNT